MTQKKRQPDLDEAQFIESFAKTKRQSALTLQLL